MHKVSAETPLSQSHNGLLSLLDHSLRHESSFGEALKENNEPIPSSLCLNKLAGSFHLVLPSTHVRSRRAGPRGLALLHAAAHTRVHGKLWFSSPPRVTPDGEASSCQASLPAFEKKLPEQCCPWPTPALQAGNGSSIPTTAASVLGTLSRCRSRTQTGSWSRFRVTLAALWHLPSPHLAPQAGASAMPPGRSSAVLPRVALSSECKDASAKFNEACKVLARADPSPPPKSCPKLQDYFLRLLADFQSRFSHLRQQQPCPGLSSC